MTMNNFLRLFLLPTLVYGGIIVKIDLTTPQPTIKVLGATKHLVTNLEKKTFGIEDGQLKNAVAILTNDDTPVKNIHSKQVQTTVDSKSLNITYNCVKSGSWDYVQNEMTIKNYWETMDKISVNESIKYIVKAEKNILFESAWDGNISRSDYLGKINASKEEKSRLDVPFVTAVRCDAVMVMEYEARLSGNVMVELLSKHKKFNFKSYDLAKLQSAANMKSSVFNTETLYISYYYKKQVNDDNVNYDDSHYDYEGSEDEDNVEDLYYKLNNVV